MTDATADLSHAPLTTADGRPLKAALAESLAVRRRRALLLVAPLFLFILISFIVPIGQMLFKSVYNDGFSANVPALSAWFDAHPPGSAIDETAYAALQADLVGMKRNKTAGVAGTRINYDVAGTRSLFTAGARGADKMKPPYKEAFLKLDKKWADPNVWRAMRSAASPFTMDFYLAANDLKRDEAGAIVAVPEGQAVYKKLMLRTLTLSLEITAICLLIGFPIAHLLATLPMRKAMLLMIFVLLPFWTSLLVRTTAWMVLLQQQGVLNDLLVWLGVIDDKGRIQMIYNEMGTIIAMTHILLPFTILPLYSVMKTIPPSYVRAARSLGATSWTAFRRVYLPQTLPGVGAGGLLVFILAMGYYITPALVGGADGQMISNLIAFHMQKSLNWSLAAALAAQLLIVVLIFFWIYDRIVGIDKMKLG
ncbi:ABC transporter permease [Rhodobacter capsulatus]|uniref:Polyamine ABC transporter, permease protein PotB-1 n=1 Tax=Rhodobacter capsulatus (strain ATCC BAA-309 / NBRC 16581 / SB1003) TaxID=272942 RepID=D5ASB1_RHOCB|nr:ABC transporter permease [Rhodobacter capsulatus]ADE85002.1 polyamine ABC transporter, permease protein PotB-1 [Rhodobacter capsulatus SB 1003]ETD02432.1 polyamine ABC transporter substrate-binding protein [Rhodobacter capsulatus DE442]ETD77724.1 polyamine ABC transporter substrate-binding protein [Rhodobacter capsulatus R121]ETE54374.1 polyamine ABC transporter substrate-binding protein [Rhodobacter capsulatus Y262]MDS0926657.1 ABC transporter permease [Rhodobacter capsulatus]